jgi:hypothetical protein
MIAIVILAGLGWLLRDVGSRGRVGAALANRHFDKAPRRTTCFRRADRGATGARFRVVGRLMVEGSITSDQRRVLAKLAPVRPESDLGALANDAAADARGWPGSGTMRVASECGTP